MPLNSSWSVSSGWSLLGFQTTRSSLNSLSGATPRNSAAVLRIDRLRAVFWIAASSRPSGGLGPGAGAGGGGPRPPRAAAGGGGAGQVEGLPRAYGGLPIPAWSEIVLEGESYQIGRASCRERILDGRGV